MAIRVAEAFGAINTVIGKIKDLALKQSPNKKKGEPPLMPWVAMLEKKMTEYADARLELDTVNSACVTALMASAAESAKPLMTDAATDTVLTSYWWSASNVNNKNIP